MLHLLCFNSAPPACACIAVDQHLASPLIIVSLATLTNDDRDHDSHYHDHNKNNNDHNDQYLECVLNPVCSWSKLFKDILVLLVSDDQFDNNTISISDHQFGNDDNNNKS